MEALSLRCARFVCLCGHSSHHDCLCHLNADKNINLVLLVSAVQSFLIVPQ